MSLDQSWYLDKQDEDHVIYWHNCHTFHSILEKVINNNNINCEYVGLSRDTLTDLIPKALTYVDPNDYRNISEVAACVSDLAEMLLHNPDKNIFYYNPWW